MNLSWKEKEEKNKAKMEAFFKAVNENFLFGQDIESYGRVIQKRVFHDRLVVTFFGSSKEFYFELDHSRGFFIEA